MADPAPVLQTFFVDDELQQSYQLDAVITVVDAKHILMHLDEERAEGVENESGTGFASYVPETAATLPTFVRFSLPL